MREVYVPPADLPGWRWPASGETPWLRLSGGTDPQLVFGPAGSPTAQLLARTGGIVSLDTPQLRLSQSARFRTDSPIHSNAEHVWWSGTDQVEIAISLPFATRTEAESAYWAAVIHFLRTVTRGFFGGSEVAALRGLPPPTLWLDAYGFVFLNQVPVQVQSWRVGWDPQTDFMPVPSIMGLEFALPAAGQIDMTLIVFEPFAVLARFGSLPLRRGHTPPWPSLY